MNEFVAAYLLVDFNSKTKRPQRVGCFSEVTPTTYNNEYVFIASLVLQALPRSPRIIFGDVGKLLTYQYEHGLFDECTVEFGGKSFRVKELRQQFPKLW